MDDRDFGEEYFHNAFTRPYGRDDHLVRFFERIAEAIVTEIGPRRVLDAGCAMGLLVEALRLRGVEAYGLDISSYALARVADSIRPFCWQASVEDELADSFDLIVCQEVLPHLMVAGAERAVANFCRHTRDVLFSVSPYAPSPRHANSEPPEHWAGVFARHGFFRDFAFDAGVVTKWAVRYRQTGGEVDALVRDYERRLFRLQGERDEARTSTAAAEDRIRHMERSAFWKARELWLRGRRFTTTRLRPARGEPHS